MPSTRDRRRPRAAVAEPSPDRSRDATARRGRAAATGGDPIPVPDRDIAVDGTPADTGAGTPRFATPDADTGAARRRHRADRFGRILRLLGENGSVDVAELAVDLGVSEATVRRDLRALAEQRLLERAHGGAVSGVAEMPVRFRAGHAHAEKVGIARAAAERVTDEAVVALTGGSTTLEVARCLAHRGEVSVVTNALNIAAELAVRPNVKLVVTGGVARGVSYELVGPLADATLRSINIDLAIVGADGVDRFAGLTTQNETEAATNRVLIERSRRAIVVADSSKLGRVVFAGIAPLSMMDELITDSGADPVEVERLRATGLRVTLV